MWQGRLAAMVRGRGAEGRGRHDKKMRVVEEQKEEIGEADDGEVCSRSGSRCQKQKSEAEAKKRHRALRKGRRVKKCA